MFLINSTRPDTGEAVNHLFFDRHYAPKGAVFLTWSTESYLENDLEGLQEAVNLYQPLDYEAKSE